MTRSVARLLAESLEAHDVDQVFCVPGESYVGLINALTDMNSLRLIVCRHEGGAGYMAVADGRLRSRAGCCIVSRGPGLSNAMVAIHSAYHDATPTGDAGRPGRTQGLRPHGVAGAELLPPAVGRDETGDRGDRTGAGIRGDRACLPHRRERHARPGRGDPAGGPVRREDRRRGGSAAPSRIVGSAQEDLDRLADMLANAERPLVLVGGALLADAVYDDAAYGDLRRSGGGMGAADIPHASPPATVRRDASALRRLHGHSRAAAR